MPQAKRRFRTGTNVLAHISGEVRGRARRDRVIMRLLVGKGDSMMDFGRRAVGIAIALTTMACAPEASPGEDETDGATTGVASDVSTDGSEDPDTGTTTDETSADSTDTGDTDDTDETDETGDTAGDVELEMLIWRYDASQRSRFFRYRIIDGVSDGPTLAHEDDDTSWATASVLSGHRVIYRHYNRGGPELRLGPYDGPLPADTIPLDVAPAPPGTGADPLLVPGDDAVLFRGGDVLYRVLLEGLVADPPVAVVDLDPSEPYLYQAVTLDPSGRYVVARVADGDGSSDLHRVALEDGFASEVLADRALDETESLPELSPSGDWAFFLDEDGDVDRLMVADLASGVGDVTAASADVTAPEQIFWDSFSLPRARPHAEQVGLLYAVGTPEDRTLTYVGMDGSTPLAPVPVAASPMAAGASVWSWSPDGRWCYFKSIQGQVSNTWLVHFGDGHAPEATLLASSESISPRLRWSPDGAFIYLLRNPPGETTWELARIELLDDGPAPPQLIAGPYPSAEIEDFTTEAGILLFTAATDDTNELFGVDVSGEEPGPVVTFSGPLPAGQEVQKGRFSPNDAFVAYTEAAAIFEDERLMLVRTDQPGIAEEIAEPVLGFQFVESP